MNFTTTQTLYSKTGYFSKMLVDYLDQAEQLAPFYAHPVSVQGIQAAIESRRQYETNRQLLVDELRKQYLHTTSTKKTEENINLLLSENTFTITTAHQPNIFTGQLYFIYKILHAIRLAEFCKQQAPDCNFVPVFYMGSEDADLEELGHIYINGKRHQWNTSQSGAVGRMKVDKELIKILDEAEGELSIQPHGKEIIGLMRGCYTKAVSIEDATFRMVNTLFGEYGLLILLPDNASLKRSFNPVVEKELAGQFSHALVQQTAAAFPKEYKVQAGGRELNLFYLKDDLRERIEKKEGKFTIHGSQFTFDSTQIKEELATHPDRFSANVILRPVFQEIILPNIAFIGGGGEIAYWLELKKVFEAVHVPFPMLVLRNSFLVAEKKHSDAVKKAGFTINDLFSSEQALLNELVKKESTLQLNLDKEKRLLQEFYTNLKATTGAIDKTLVKHTDALCKKALDKMEALEKKMLRAEKKKFEAQQRQLHKLKEQLFPHNSLQERIENFMPFYAKWGRGFIDAVYENSLALQQEFVVMEEE